MGESGCRSWTPGADCNANFSCDKTKNDGSCQAGCSDDAGCSASNAGVEHCTADGTTELTCTQVGACYVFKTTRSDVAQGCVSPTYCGAASGRRVSCVASAAGACTQHVAAYDDCPTGTACTGAGMCTATTTPGPTTGCYSATQAFGTAVWRETPAPTARASEQRRAQPREIGRDCVTLVNTMSPRPGKTATFSISVDAETRRILKREAKRSYAGNVSALVSAIAREAKRQAALDWLLQRSDTPAMTDAQRAALLAEIDARAATASAASAATAAKAKKKRSRKAA